MAESLTFPMVSHRKPAAAVADAKLHQELTRLHADLTAHRALMPHWSMFNDRANWVHKKDFLITEIEMIESQLRNRWHEVSK